MKDIMKAYFFVPLSFLAAGFSNAQNKQKPNVVVILSDDVGYGDISCYGAERVSTPNIDALAERGVRFTDAHACASTSTPSRYGMLTGEYPWRRNGTGIADGDAALIISPDIYTLPKLFKEHGYATAAIGKWHLGIGTENGTQDWNRRLAPGPKEIGFDYSFIMAATADRVPCVYLENQEVLGLDPNDPISVSYKENFPGEPTGKSNPELVYKLKPSPNHGHNQSIVNGISRIGYMKGGRSALWRDEDIADRITEKAIDFINCNKSNPFFLYLGTNDIHVPRFPHERFRGKTDMGVRGDAIAQLDWTVGQIVKTLEKAGILDNTIIVFTSDNGPVVDDGYADESVKLLKNHKPWGPFRGGKYSAFEAGTRVPFIVSWPQIDQVGVSKALISQVDMLATFAQLFGQDVSNQPHLDSSPQLRAWMGEDENGRPYIISAAHVLSVSTADWKYIEPGKGSAYNPLVNIELGISSGEQLYDLKHDRGEYDNLIDDPKNTNVIEKMRNILLEEKAKGIGLKLR